MELIENFSMRSFSRLIWMSREAKETWSGAIERMASFVQELEVESVKENHRLCAWQTISEESVPELATKWAEMGLVSLPLKRVSSFGGFSHKHEIPKRGTPASVCMVVAKTLSACLKFKKYHASDDNINQGLMLGFPKCCAEFFETSWRQGFFDPIWQAATASPASEESDNRIRVVPHPYSNAVLRYIGIRIGFHIPCSFNCGSTVALATERMKLAKKKDKDLSLILESLLQMPMEWSVLNGIGVVKTPIFYLVFQSVPTYKKYVVVADGRFLPKESCYVG